MLAVSPGAATYTQVVGDVSLGHEVELFIPPREDHSPASDQGPRDRSSTGISGLGVAEPKRCGPFFASAPRS